MHPGDKRRNPRRSITYPASIDLGVGVAPRECVLCDASQEGALLTVSDPDSLPDEFTLALSAGGAARRRCKVAWRTENQIGVSFIEDVKPVPTRMPMMRPISTVQPASAQEAGITAAADPFDIDTLAKA
jgi:hypothetical protein